MAVTLKDVAQALNVSTTTVHKALYNKAGISRETCERVLFTAARMGYRPNYMAAALKRKLPVFAVALPRPEGESRYYYGNLWQGAERFLQQVRDFRPEMLRCAYDGKKGEHARALEGLLKEHGEKLSGVLTVASPQGESAQWMRAFREKGIPVALVGSDADPAERLCCIKAHDHTAGRLAAELIAAFGAPDGKRILAIGHAGVLGMRDQAFNLEGFQDALAASSTAEVQVLWGGNAQEVREKLRDALQMGDMPHAIYCSSARVTIAAAEELQSLQLSNAPRLIGNDCFAKSNQLLKEGVLTAIIDKKISQQAHLGMQALFDFAVKRTPPPQPVLAIDPEVVLRGSLAHREE